MKRNVLNSPRLLGLKKHRQRAFLNKTISTVIIFIIIFIGLGFLSKIARLNIANVEINGNKIIEEKFIKEKVNTELAGYYLWLFPKSNIFFYPKNKIVENLTVDFKRLKDISFNINGERILQISVTEREAVYTWCGATLPEATNDTPECYFLDEKGFVFDEAPYFSEEVYFKFYGKIPQIGNTPLGSRYLENNLERLVVFKNILTEIGLKPVALSKEESGDINIYLSSVTQKMGPKIIFNMNADFEKLTENLQTALNTEPLQNDFKKKYFKLLYIDLRYGNKVFYKFSARGGSASGGN